MAITKRMRLPLPRNASFKPRPWRAARSSWIASSISAISPSTAGSSVGRLRRKARLVSASSLRSTEASQRGDSRTVKSPRSMIPSGTIWKPKGSCQTRWVALSGPFATPSVHTLSAGALEERRVGRTVKEVRDHDTHGDHDLEHAGDTPTDVLRARLGHVSRGDGGDATDADTADNTTTIKEVQTAASAVRDSGEDLQRGG